MLKKFAIVAAVAVAVAGCDDSNDGGYSKVEEAANKKAADAVSVLNNSGQKAADATATATTETTEAVTETAKTATEEAKAVAEDVTAKATKIIEEGMTALKNKDVDGAKAKLAELTAMKDKLSPELLKQYENLKKAVEAGGIADGVKGLLGK